MSLLLASIAVLAAALMGYCVQRGATCMVAAVDQVVRQRKFSRLLGLAETCLWVSGLLVLARIAGIDRIHAPDFPTGWLVLAGGALLGAGALLNGACVFGAIARIGSGDWHYLLTPPAFLLGCWLTSFLPEPAAAAADITPAVHGAYVLLLLPAVALLLPSAPSAIARLGFVGWLMQPRQATILIGCAFVVLLLVGGPWTYTETLWSIAHGRETEIGFHLLLFVALAAGALAGGRGRRVAFRLSAKTAGACIAGGLLMGIGASFVPGGNDNLILIGLPFLQPYAWLAMAGMIGAILLGMLVPMWMRRLETR